jgi:poly(ADP-ribose) glycohydrolase
MATCERDEVTTTPNQTTLSQGPCPESFFDLTEVIAASGARGPDRSFERLEEAIERSPRFLQDTLPFIWQESLRAPELLPDIPLLASVGTVRLTQRQCLCISANAFLCTYTDRPSDNCLSGSKLPSINFDELYGGRGWGSVEVAKLRMIFAYFGQLRERLAAGDELSREIAFTRRGATESSVRDWEQCDKPLLKPVVHGLGESLDDAKNMFRVDFANRIIGGAAIAYGCVQEEIMFCECPEMIVSRLFCSLMRANEAIVIIGAEQFSQHSGYAGTLRYEGRYSDRTPIENGILSSHVVAIDALDLRSGGTEAQYTGAMILRELTKAWAGFALPNAPSEIATGNWGCGVFGGDPELKSIIQWLACSRAGKTMNYFPFDNARVLQQLPELAEGLISRGATVGALAKFVFRELKPGGAYVQFATEFQR